MESPKDTPEYWDLINELPTEYRNSYHKPMQWGLQFIVMISTAKRGREGNIRRFSFKLFRIKLDQVITMTKNYSNLLNSLEIN